MPEPSTGDRNSHGFRVDELGPQNCGAVPRTSVQDQGAARMIEDNCDSVDHDVDDRGLGAPEPVASPHAAVRLPLPSIAGVYPTCAQVLLSCSAVFATRASIAEWDIEKAVQARYRAPWPQCAGGIATFMIFAAVMTISRS
jgi:hypothetical protein